MSYAKDVLAELAGIGAVGEDAPPKLSLGQVELLSGVPPASMVDRRGAVMVGGLSELSSSLRKISEEANRAAEACERLGNTWSHVAGAPVEAASTETTPREETPHPVVAEVSEPQLAASGGPMSPEDLEMARDMVRRKIRGEHLTEEVRAELMGEAAMVEDRDAPASSFPSDLTPSYPQEVQDGEV